MSHLRIKPPGQEVPVEVLHDGQWVPGYLWAWQLQWSGRWGGWVRSPHLPERCWDEEEMRTISGRDLPFEDAEGT